MQKEEAKEIEEAKIKEEERRRRAKKAQVKKEELQVVVPKKRKEEVEDVELKRREERRILFPVIDLETPKVKSHRLEIDREITKIIKEARKSVIPVLEIQKTTFKYEEREINIEIPQIKKKEKLINVPIIKPRKLPKVRTLITEFDSRIMKPQIRLLPKVRVPIYRKSIFAPPRAILSYLERSINEQVSERLKERPELETLLVTKKVPALVRKPSVGGDEEKSIPDFFELTFGEGAGGIRTGEAKIILLKDFEDDSHISFLKALCERIYREKEGGKPETVTVLKIDKIGRGEIERWMKPSGKIFTVDLDYTEDDRKLWLEIDEYHLWERLSEIRTAKTGFVIFVTKDEDTFERYKELLGKIKRRAQSEIDILTIRSSKLPLELASLASGLFSLNGVQRIVVIDEKTKTPIIMTFDTVFNEFQKRFQKILNNMKDEEDELFKLATRRNKGQIEGKKSESDLHYDLKVFLVRYLVYKLRRRGQSLKNREEIMKVVRTEEGNTSPVPDIQVGSEVYEVETLFGETDKKIDETIDKYDQTSEITRVNILMDNLGFLIHLKSLINKKKQIKKKFKIEFYTLDLQNKKLISLSDIINKINNLKIKT